MIFGVFLFISSIEIFFFFFLGIIQKLWFCGHYSRLNSMQIYTFCITLLYFFYTKLKKLYICTNLTNTKSIMKHIIRVLFLTLFSLTTFATVHEVNSGMFFYEPSSLTINIGDTVVWVNDGGTHDVNGNINTITGETFGNPESFSSSATNVVGATIYTHVFDIAGTYKYDCSVGNHALQGMTGTIIVEGSNGTVVDIVVNSDDLNILQSAVLAAELAGTLSGNGPFTVFAPTDAAFDALADGVLDGLLENIDALTAVLYHHVHSGNVLSTDLSDDMQVPTLNEDTLTVSIDGNVVMIDMSTVTVADIVAENGVVHVIDMVLIPETNDQTVMSIIANSPVHTTLNQAIEAAGLVETLSGDGPFTVFAPVDSAFNGLPDGALELILANTDQLTELLFNHVHSGEVYSEDLEDGMMVPTLNNTELEVSIEGMTVMINLSTVIQADQSASNGVVHIIDQILTPEVGQVDSTVWSIIEFSPIHTTLEAAIIAAELDGALSGEGPFTVFAPTDDAFGALPAGTVDALLADIPQLSSILLHHVHPDNALAEDLMNGMEIPTMNDDVLVVNIDGSSVMIDMATVVQADLEADNGVVHFIDMVLIPDTDPTGVESLFKGQDVEYLHTINLLGELVDRNSTDKVLIDIYSNGTSVKRYNLRK